MKSEPEILSSPDTLGPRMTTLEQADSSSALPSESGNWLGLLAVREHRKQMVEWGRAGWGWWGGRSANQVRLLITSTNISVSRSYDHNVMIICNACMSNMPKTQTW